jgi:CO/xanthine dehydrogenase FAD-binding subunit
MIMRFDYCRPKSLLEALEILAKEGEKVRVLAGGTDLLVNIQEGVDDPELVVDIGEMEELKGIEEESGVIELGPLVTHAGVMASEFLKEKAPVLVAACSEVGAPQIRARGTIGGNLAAASPAGDSIPALYVLGATVVLKSREEEREVPIENFFTRVKQSVLRPDELLTAVRFPAMNEAGRYFFKKLGQRKALAIAKVTVAACLVIREGLIENIRIALGAVAPTVIRASRAESYLEGHSLTEEVIARAGQLISEESRAISDIRSTEEYRNEMTGLLLMRGLAETKEKTLPHYQDK